jgi:hypothetical protein
MVYDWEQIVEEEWQDNLLPFFENNSEIVSVYNPSKNSGEKDSVFLTGKH